MELRPTQLIFKDGVTANTHPLNVVEVAEDGTEAPADEGEPEHSVVRTVSPCRMCAKLIVQANVSHVFYREAYRESEGLRVLEQAGVVTVHYTRWKDEWR
jgi:deoxycytidylate deaminase